VNRGKGRPVSRGKRRTVVCLLLVLNAEQYGRYMFAKPRIRFKCRTGTVSDQFAVGVRTDPYMIGLASFDDRLKAVFIRVILYVCHSAILPIGTAAVICCWIGGVRAGLVCMNTQILWVDDVPVNNIAEIESFEALGVEVVTTTTTDQALEALGKKRFDLVISDMGRPPDERAPR
jgi:hypothetical protein